MRKYDVLKKMPVAKFYYQGTHHTHPVRRTVVMIEDRPNLIIGYELRDGNVVRHLDSAPVKSFRKDRIAKYGDYSRLRMKQTTFNKKCNESTLQRLELIDLISSGA